MNTSYQLKRVCGSVYSNGNAIFSVDGNSVISPVGNQVNVFNLVEQTTSTLNFENRKNIKRCVFSNNGLFLITVDVEGHALFINYPNQIVLHRFHFKRKVYDIKFSPDDLFFVVTFGHGVQIWKSPNAKREFVPLSLKRTLTGHYDDTTCVDWDTDGRSIVMGSKDLTIRVYMNVRSKFMSLHKLSGHRDRIIGVYFSSDNQIVYSVARDGALFTWKLEQQSQEVSNVASVGTNKSRNNDNDEDEEGDDYANDDDEDSFLEDEGDDDNESSDDDDDDDEDDESEVSDLQPQTKRKRAIKPPKKTNYTHSINRGKWVLANREFLWDHNYYVTSTAFHKKSNLLVVGFNNGVFSLYELPNCVSIQRISISNASITTVGINNTGEWLVLGSASLSQLLIWEWKSESYILKQQGHLYGMNGVDFSSDGMFIATAGEDAKVKIWSAVSGFCVVTLTEHIAPVTGVKFVGKGTAKAILSCSLDGTVRAHDLLRYKNFRTLTTATPVQFTSVASDSSGEVVCAGSLDPFQIYVWSLQSGHLLEVLAGHEGPIACMEFTAYGGLLLSGSWDGTLKVWDVYKNECVDTMEHGCDVLSVSVRPDGKEVCTCATNGTIFFWDIESATQVKFIEGRRDLSSGRRANDARTAESSALSKHFKTVAYSPDGTCVLAGGHSKYVCLYAAASGSLLGKFELSMNRSLDGMSKQLRSDQLVDGIALDTLQTGNDSDEELQRGNDALPGAEKGGRTAGKDDGSRSTKPALVTSSLRFSSSGREWAAATSQGLQVFGLDESLIFAPEDLTIEATPENISHAIKTEKYAQALVLALQLSSSETEVLKAALEAVPVKSIDIVIKSVNPKRYRDLFGFLSKQIMTSQNIEYYLRWTWQLLRLYGPNLRRDAASSLPLQETLRGLLRAIKIHETETLHACEENLHLLRFVESQQVFKLKQQEGVSIVSNDENINGDMDANDIEESLENISYPILEFKQIQKYIYDHGLDKEFSTDLSAVPVSKSTATSTIATQSRIKKSYSDDQQTAPQSIPNNNQSIELVSAVTSSALDLEGPWTSNWHDDDDADPANDISTDDDNFEGNEIDIEDNDTHTAPPSKVQKSTLGTNSKYHQQQETKSTKDHITLLDVGDGRMVEVVNVDSVMRARLLQKRIK